MPWLSEAFFSYSLKISGTSLKVVFLLIYCGEIEARKKPLVIVGVEMGSVKKY